MFTRMDVFDWSVSKGQRDNRLRLSGQTDVSSVHIVERLVWLIADSLAVSYKSVKLHEIPNGVHEG